MKEENDHVDLHEVRGFASDTVMGALNEAYAVSRGTKCRKFLYSLSLNPPHNETVSTEAFEIAIEQAEERLGLSGQPRAIVFHEKEGRRHAHAVWSRINVAEMKAVHISHDHMKLNKLSRDLFIEHGWKMPRGLVNSQEADPKNFTLAEWQAAKRAGKDPRAIKTAFQDAWAISDSKTAFVHALEERGFMLAKGRRGHIAIDHMGGEYSVARQAKVKTKDVRQRLGDESTYLSPETVKDKIARGIIPVLYRLQQELSVEANTEIAERKEKKQRLIMEQREQRQECVQQIAQRQRREALKRQARFRTGVGGIWDWLNGKHLKTQRRNERDAQESQVRDRTEKDALIQKQLGQRTAFNLENQNRKQTYLAKRKELKQDVEIYQQMRMPEKQQVSAPDPRDARRQAYMQQRQSASTRQRSDRSRQNSVKRSRPPKPEH